MFAIYTTTDRIIVGDRITALTQEHKLRDGGIYRVVAYKVFYKGGYMGYIADRHEIRDIHRNF